MISAVILTKNEEKNIEECLKTLEWCDEIVIVDDYSNDATVQKSQAVNNKCRIYKRHLGNDFASQRNFGLKKAKGDWVLFIDADERVSPQLQEEIESVINNKQSTANGYYLKREDKIWGKTLRYGETSRVRFLRLGRKNAGVWKRRVDEYWEIPGPTKTLKNPLIHYPHQTISEFLESVNFFSTLNAQVFYEEGRRVTFLDWFKPGLKFLQNWIFRLGFLDGMPGFMMALMMSFHSFLVRAKLYLLWKQRRKRKIKKSKFKTLDIRFLILLSWIIFVLIKYVFMLGKRGGIW